MWKLKLLLEEEEEMLNGILVGLGNGAFLAQCAILHLLGKWLGSIYLYYTNCIVHAIRLFVTKCLHRLPIMPERVRRRFLYLADNW